MKDSIINLTKNYYSSKQQQPAAAAAATTTKRTNVIIKSRVCSLNLQLVRIWPS